MKLALTALTLALAASACHADNVDPELQMALKASSEAEFLANAGDQWKSLGNSRFETIDDSGRTMTVGFGESALKADIAELAGTIAAQEKEIAGEADEARTAELTSSIESYQRALNTLLTARENERTVIGTGVLAGCSADVGLTATFEGYIGLVDYGYAKLEAETSEFGPYGPGAGTVTLTAVVNGIANSQNGGMGGLSYMSVEQWGGPDWGCLMEARASIVPYCSVSGYRNVRWTSTCEAAAAGTAPTRSYSNYRR